MQLPIQTQNYVVPELQVFVSSLQISTKRAHPCATSRARFKAAAEPFSTGMVSHLRHFQELYQAKLGTLKIFLVFYPEIATDSFMYTLYTFKQQLALKIVLLQTSFRIHVLCEYLQNRILSPRSHLNLSNTFGSLFNYYLLEFFSWGSCMILH